MSTPESTQKLPEYSAEEQKMLQGEKFVAEILNIRNPQREKPKPNWQIFLESTGGAALITVFIGGLLVSIVTLLYQSKQATIERERAARERLQQLRFQATADSLTLVSSTVAASEDLLQLTTEPFLQAIPMQRNTIRGAYISTDSGWRKQADIVIGFKLGYYFRDYPAVITAWQEVQSAVTKYDNCAGSWIDQHPRYSPGLPDGCKTERTNFDQALNLLQAAMPTLNN